MFDDNFFLFAKAVWAAGLIGLLLPVLGRHLVLGRSILLGLAVPQVAMTGIAFVFLAAGLHWSWAERIEEDSAKALVGSLLFGLPGLVLIAAPWRKSRSLDEGRLAGIYLGALATTHLIMSSDAVGETYLSDLFHGQLLFIGEEGLRALAIVLVASALLVLALRRRLLAVLTDSDFAKVCGVSCGAWSLASVILQGAVIGVTVATAGPLVTFGFLVLPVLAAGCIARSLRLNLWLSSLFGLAAALGGFWISYHYDRPLGDTAVATACGFLIVAAAAASSVRLFRRMLSPRVGQA